MSEMVLVTGSTGFIGTRLLHFLSVEGTKVRALLRPESDGSSLPCGVDVVRAGFENREALGRVVQGVDRIVHLAGVTKARDDDAFDAGNVMPVRNLLFAVSRHNPGLKRFLLVSSLAAAGPAREGMFGVLESDEPRPVSAYGRSKLRAEQLCMRECGAVPFTIVRPPVVYGPGDRDVLQVFRMFTKGVLVSVGKDRKQRCSIIFVDDLVRGIMAAARSDRAAAQIYYLSSPDSCSWEEFAAASRPVLGFGSLRSIRLPDALVILLGAVGGVVGRLSGKPPLINRDKVNELVQDYWVCSARKAAKELGFIAGTPLVEGVAETVAWYRMKGWL